MEYPQITIVDDKDNLIGYQDYPKAIEEGMIRRVSSVYVFDTDGRLLLQKRSEHVRYPLLFDASSSGHVDKGETYLQAAERELYEELSLSDIPLKEIVLSYRTSECFVGIYKATIAAKTPIIFNAHEIESIEWKTPKEVDMRITQEPQLFIDVFIQQWIDLRATLTSHI